MMMKKEVKQCQCEEPSGAHPETDQLGFWMACNDCGGRVAATYEYFEGFGEMKQRDVYYVKNE